MKTNLLNVCVMLLTSLALAGCSMDVNLMGKISLGSIGVVGDGPTTTLPMGNYSLQINKTLGKNAWLGLNGMAQVSHGGLVDDAGNTTFIGDQALYVYDANGAELRKVDLPTTSGYQNWVGERVAMVRTSSGDLYLLGRVNTSGTFDWGLLKISAAGVVTKMPLTGGLFGANGGWDIVLVTPTSGPEELHIIPNVMVGMSFDNNRVEVYDLSGTFVRDYASAENLRFMSIAQNPVDKKTYALADNGASTVAVYNEDGTLSRTFNLNPTLVRGMDINFDNSGYMYVSDQGDTSIIGGDPNRGISVFDVTGTPTVVRTMKNSVSHPLNMGSFAVSPNGNIIAGYNYPGQQNTAIDEQWNLSGSVYQFTKLLSSRGTGDDDFNASGSFGALVLDKNENFYVDDNRNKRIKVYSMNGVFKYAFSDDDASVTFWDEHFVGITSADKIVTGGYEYSYGATGKVHFKVREKDGTQISAAFVSFTALSAIPKFLGIDSDDQMWFDDNAKYYRVNLSGAITNTIDYAGNPASLGVTGVYLGQVAGDKLYFLDSADLSLHALDVDTGAYTQVMGATQYAAGNLFAVVPSGSIQLLAGGKLVVSAIADDYMTRLYVVIDPATNYSVVTKISSVN